MRLLFYLGFLSTMGLLYLWSQDPATDAAAARVMQIALASLGAGLAVNVLCLSGGFAYVSMREPPQPKPTIPGISVPSTMTTTTPEAWSLTGLSDACMPYSIVAVAVGARLYTFGEPLGVKERLYIRETPTRAGQWALVASRKFGEGLDWFFRHISLYQPNEKPSIRRRTEDDE